MFLIFGGILMGMPDTQRERALSAVGVERHYQGLVRVRNHETLSGRGLGDWLIFIERQLFRAKNDLYSLDQERVLHRFRKIAALAVAAMETHGVRERPASDISGLEDLLAHRQEISRP
ncbi:hypothetical protein M0R72_08915 [Candidatus Pacearchaeota archaeon]|nr:hypothetical protein [Candidatus Pacearchaeota archaeon]